MSFRPVNIREEIMPQGVARRNLRELLFKLGIRSAARRGLNASFVGARIYPPGVYYRTVVKVDDDISPK